MPPTSGYARNGGCVMARAQFDFGGSMPTVIGDSLFMAEKAAWRGDRTYCAGLLARAGAPIREVDPLPDEINTCTSNYLDRQIALINPRMIVASVKGFGSVNEAAALCSALRHSGGSCFVRNVAGDTPVQIASR